MDQASPVGAREHVGVARAQLLATALSRAGWVVLCNPRCCITRGSAAAGDLRVPHLPPPVVTAALTAATAATRLPPPDCCRPGLSARQPLFGGPGPSHDDQLQINIESGTLDLDDEIEQLRGSVGRLKQVGLGACCCGRQRWDVPEAAMAVHGIAAARSQLRTAASEVRQMWPPPQLRCRPAQPVAAHFPQPPANHPLPPTRQVSEAISEENRLTTQVMDGLESAMEQARASLKKTMKRLGRAYEQSRSNHMLYLILFALALFFAVYFWNRLYRLLSWIFK